MTGTIWKSSLNISIFMCVHVLSLHSYRKYVRSYKFQIFGGFLQTLLSLYENQKVYFPRNLTSRGLWNLGSQYLDITSWIFASLHGFHWKFLPLCIVYPYAFLFIYSSFLRKEFWWARNRQKKSSLWKHWLCVIFIIYPCLFCLLPFSFPFLPAAF